MDAWQTIRDFFTRGLTPGTAGYMAALCNASQLFVKLEINHEEIAWVDSLDHFQVDPEVTDALIMSSKLKEIGVLK